MFRFYSREASPIQTPALKDTTTSIVVRGDTVKRSSGTFIRMATATDNADFAGIALDSSPAGDNDPYRIMEPIPHNCGIPFVLDLDTATAVVAGEQLKFASSGNGTSYQQITKCSVDTDAIVVCHKANSGSSAKEVIVRMRMREAELGDA